MAVTRSDAPGTAGYHLSMTVNGIDTSSWQGAYDWEPWRGRIGFGMVQATDGASYTDPDFAHDWAAMKTLGLVRFAYHYARPQESSPAFQARRLVATAREHGLSEDDHFVLDLETSGGLPPHEVSTWARSFCRAVNSTGRRCLVYTFPAFAEAGNCAGLGDWHLWIADFGVSEPAVPPPWDRWHFWQWTGTGIDQDRWNGTEDELKTFARVPVPGLAALPADPG